MWRGEIVSVGAVGADLRVDLAPSSSDAPPTATSVILNRIQRGRPPPELTSELRRRIAGDFATWRVDAVVLGPMANRQVMDGFLTELLGRPPATAGGVAVWHAAAVAPPPDQPSGPARRGVG